MITQVDEYNYEYPDNLDLRPSSDFHRKLCAKVVNKGKLAYDCISPLYNGWRKIDDTLKTYIPVDAHERGIKKKDSRKPISIVFPYSSGILDSLLSYMTGAFYRDPIIKYEGVEPNDIIGTTLLEKIVQLDCVRNKVFLNMHTLFRDGLVYNVGACAPTWKQSYGYYGNALNNISPYNMLIDPNVNFHEIQDSEFFGWVDRTNYQHLLMDEMKNDDMFNVKHTKRLSDIGSFGDIYTNVRPTITGNIYDQDKTLLYELYMYIWLIPKEWGINDVEEPELWYFRIINDEVIISARRADFEHNMIPVVMISPDYDGHTTDALGKLSVVQGLQDVLNFQFNSRIAALRKAINQTIIYNPWILNGKDLEEGKSLIRLNKAAWNADISTMIQQLPYNDNSQNNIGEATWTMQYMDGVLGVGDFAKGTLRQSGPERLTGTEFQGTARGAMSRLERTAALIGIQGMQDIGMLFAYHTQQMMDDVKYVKITNNLEKELLSQHGYDVINNRVPVSIHDLDVKFDVIVRDGSIPGGNYNSVWVDIFRMIVSDPLLMKSYDHAKIFEFIARNNGAKNIQQFLRDPNYIKAQAMPDEQVAKQVQAGNLVGIGDV